MSFLKGSLRLIRGCVQTAISSISTDIEKEDWESATRHMQRALNIDPSIVASEFAQAVVVSFSVV